MLPVSQHPQAWLDKGDTLVTMLALDGLSYELTSKTVSRKIWEWANTLMGPFS